MKLNKWEMLKNFINKQPIGNTITRKDILYLIYKKPRLVKSSYGSTIDNYRRCLELLGILNSLDRGLYKIEYHIKNDLSSTELKKLAYGRYRRWFNDVKEEN